MLKQEIYDEFLKAMSVSDFERMDDLKKERLFDANMKHGLGDPILVTAIENRYAVEVIDKLIEYGADMNLNGHI